MKKIIKVISLSLAAVIATSALVGCGNKQQNTGDMTEDGKPIIRYFLPQDPGSEIRTDTWSVLKWGEKTGTKIEIIEVQRDVFAEKLAAVLASGDLPEYINYRYDQQTAEKYGSKLFVAYEDYIDDMPNLTKWFEKYPDVYEKCKSFSDNKMYSFPRIQDFNMYNALWSVREDLLNQAGMSADDIVTIDDLKEALLALKKVSGQPYVTSCRMGWTYFAEMTGYFFGTSPNMMFDNRRSDSSNTFIYGPTGDMYKEWVKFFKWAYENEVLHPSFATMTQQELLAGYSDGKFQLHAEQAGMFGTLGGFDDRYPDRIEKPIFPVEINGERAKQPLMHHQNNNSRYPVTITKASPNVNAAVKAFDWLYSEEGHELTVYGEEGVHWVADDSYMNGKCSLLQGSWHSKQQLKNGEITQEEYDEIPTSQKLGLSSAWLQPVMDEYQRYGNACEEDKQYYANTIEKRKNVDSWIEQGYVLEPDPVVKFTEEEQEIIVDLTATLETYVSEQSLKFIYGDLDIEKDWDAFQAQLVEFGSDKLEKMYNDRYNEMFK